MDKKGTNENQRNFSNHFSLMAQLPLNCVSTSVFHFHLLLPVLSATWQEQVDVKHTCAHTIFAVIKLFKDINMHIDGV